MYSCDAIKPEINYYMRPRILIGCERSGKVRDAFIRRGFEAVSCDLEASDSDFGPHIQGDVIPLLREEWDLAILHPVCRYLCNSGVRWLYKNGSIDPVRWKLMEEGAEFFVKCLKANAKRLAVENPIPHKYAMKIIQQHYTQIIQPHQHGHGETKATCLWLKQLPVLHPSNKVAGRAHRIHSMAPGPNRSRLRSETFDGIADAFAEQWGAVLEESGFTAHNKQSTPCKATHDPYQTELAAMRLDAVIAGGHL